MSKQSILIASLVAIALGALILGAAYQGDRDLDAVVIGGETSETTLTEAETSGGRIVQQDGNLTEPSDDGSTFSPIQRFLPASSSGSNCREPIGVDLIEGYAATLVINGTRIAPEDMNGPDPDTGAIPAERTQGQYTFGPEENCPNGALLRPRDNVLQACVYKIEQGLQHVS